MNGYTSIDDALKEMYPDIFAQVSGLRATLLANSMVEFLDDREDAANYCCGLKIFTSKIEARKQYREWQKKYIGAVMKIVVDGEDGLYLVYATDP